MLVLLIAFFELVDARPDGGGGRGAVFYFSEKASGFLRILAGDEQHVIQLDPGFAGVLHSRTVGLEPVAERGGALLLRESQRGVVSRRQSGKIIGIYDRRGGIFVGIEFFILHFVPIFKQLPSAEGEEDNYQGDY